MNKIDSSHTSFQMYYLDLLTRSMASCEEIQDVYERTLTWISIVQTQIDLNLKNAALLCVSRIKLKLTSSNELADFQVIKLFLKVVKIEMRLEENKKALETIQKIESLTKNLARFSQKFIIFNKTSALKADLNSGKGKAAFKSLKKYLKFHLSRNWLIRIDAPLHYLDLAFYQAPRDPVGALKTYRKVKLMLANENKDNKINICEARLRSRLKKEIKEQSILSQKNICKETKSYYCVDSLIKMANFFLPHNPTMTKKILEEAIVYIRDVEQEQQTSLLKSIVDIALEFDLEFAKRVLEEIKDPLTFQEASADLIVHEGLHHPERLQIYVSQSYQNPFQKIKVIAGLASRLPDYQTAEACLIAAYNKIESIASSKQKIEAYHLLAVAFKNEEKRQRLEEEFVVV